MAMCSPEHCLRCSRSRSGRCPTGGSVVLHSRFLDCTGVFMLHCHMMNHEDMGMMQAVEVCKDGPNRR
jgi:Multicopper oxidase